MKRLGLEANGGRVIVSMVLLRTTTLASRQNRAENGRAIKTVLPPGVLLTRVRAPAATRQRERSIF